MNDDDLKQSSRKQQQQNEYFSTHPAHETRSNHLEKQLPNVKLIKLN
jgi:predicted Zn-dependent protease